MFRLAVALLVALLATSAAAGPTVYSLDQCADQYVLALSPRADIVGLSRRATNTDSYLRSLASGLPLRRASPEQVLAVGPAVVVRYWGGDERFLADLMRRHVKVVRIDDATDFAGIRANVRRVAKALGREDAGEVLVTRMDTQLAAARGAWGGTGAVYLTSGGDTAGQDTLIDAMLRAAGMTNLSRDRGYRPVPLESLILDPPAAIVTGFFDPDDLAMQRWSIGRHAVLRGLLAGRTLVSLPGALVGCPAWFAGEAVERIAAAHAARAAGHAGS